MKRAYKYRFYPTEQQKHELLRTFGCVHKVYNLALDARTRAWCKDQRRIKFAYLSEVSSVPLQQCLRHLQSAFANFFDKRANYPTFKSWKKSRGAAAYTRSGFRWRDGRLTLAKMGEPLRIVWSRPLPEGAEPSTVTVSCDAAGRWHVSLVVETTIDHLAAGSVVGVDAGIDTLLTLSTGEKIGNPRYERRDRAGLAKAQRNLARKTKGSANRDKARRKVARVYARIADRRRDHLHKVVRGMLSNRSLARAISDASWSEFRSMLEYKAQWYGREVIAVDRWFPLSKTCSTCGRVTETMPLTVRQWSCPCGVTHDRDVNAAKNVLAAGLAVTACGGDVRPTRHTPARQSPAKQETPPARVGISRL